MQGLEQWIRLRENVLSSRNQHGPDGDTNPDADRNSDTDPDVDTHPDVDPNADMDSDLDTDADADADPDLDTDTDADPNLGHDIADLGIDDGAETRSMPGELRPAETDPGTRTCGVGGMDDDKRVEAERMGRRRDLKNSSKADRSLVRQFSNAGVLKKVLRGNRQPVVHTVTDGLDTVRERSHIHGGNGRTDGLGIRTTGRGRHYLIIVRDINVHPFRHGDWKRSV